MAINVKYTGSATLSKIYVKESAASPMTLLAENVESGTILSVPTEFAADSLIATKIYENGQWIQPFEKV